MKGGKALSYKRAAPRLYVTPPLRSAGFPCQRTALSPLRLPTDHLKYFIGSKSHGIILLARRSNLISRALKYFLNISWTSKYIHDLIPVFFGLAFSQSEIPLPCPKSKVFLQEINQSHGETKSLASDSSAQRSYAGPSQDSIRSVLK